MDRCCIPFTVLLLTTSVAAEDARYFWDRPVDEAMMEFYYTRTHSNSSSDDLLPLVGIRAKFDTVVLHYRNYVELGNQVGFWSVQIPNVEIQAAPDGDAFNVSETRETGAGDPVIMLAGNFYGRPALSHYEYEAWRLRPAFGWAISVTLPVGEYDNSTSVNAGNNRWVATAQLNGTQPFRYVELDVGAAVSVFGVNDQFWGEFELNQNPVLVLDASLSQDIWDDIWWWAGFKGTFGGRTHLDEVPCTDARGFGESCDDGSFVDDVAFGDSHDDWRATVGLHVEALGGVVDIVIERVISDTDGERSVEVGKVAYSTRW